MNKQLKSGHFLPTDAPRAMTMAPKVGGDSASGGSAGFEKRRGAPLRAGRPTEMVARGYRLIRTSSSSISSAVLMILVAAEYALWTTIISVNSSPISTVEASNDDWTI